MFDIFFLRQSLVSMGLSPGYATGLVIQVEFANSCYWSGTSFSLKSAASLSLPVVDNAACICLPE